MANDRARHNRETKTGNSSVPLVALMVALGASSSMTFAADALSKEADFDIPPQLVESALHEFSKQANVQVMVRADAVEGIRTSGVKGHLTAENALSELLNHTDLTYEEIPGDTVAVKRLAESTGNAGAEPDRRRDSKRESSGTSRSTDESAQRRSLEEIVVTAQKREEKLQEVPISISVMSGVELDRSTAQGVTEALTQVPGVAVNVTNQGGGTQMIIRGVTAGGALAAGSSPVSYYVDMVPFGFVRNAIAPDPNAYDLERVEVLRGPQGTLYGASAQNGVVRVLTNNANLDDVYFGARTSVSTTKDGGENYRGDMAVNLPIVEGKLAARAVVGYQNLDGWIDRSNKKDINDAEISNFRLKINAQPTDRFSVGLLAWLSRADYGAPSVAADNGQSVATMDEPIATDFDIYGMKLGYDFSSVYITSATSYLEYKNDGMQDNGPFVPGALGHTVLPADVFSQEIILNSAHAGPWRWVLGGIYRDAKDRHYGEYYFPSQGSRVPFLDQLYTSESFAFFGELTREVFDGHIELTAGLRYFEDDVASRDDLRGFSGHDKFDAVSPRAVVTWHPSDKLTAYASYAEGFRSGFPQAGILLSTQNFPPADADTLHNYEIGMKGDTWDGGISFETALYYIDWRDVQQSLTVPVTIGGISTLTIANINSESASGIGVDFGVTTRPIEGVTLGATISWNDLTMDDDVSSGGVVLFEKGDRLNLSPEYTAGVSADYAFPFGREGYMARFSAAADYTSGMDQRTVVLGAPSNALGDSMLISRASFAIDFPARWTATLFVDNINNEQGSPVRFPIFSDLLPWHTRVRPRTIGVQFEYRL